MPRMPTIYLPHGGGPWPFVDLGIPPSDTAPLTNYLRALPAAAPTSPRALLVISAHWETPVPTVQTAAHPPMLYDYYNFPPASYRLQWPAPGDPALAARVRQLLSAAGIDSAEDPTRGYDHGTFIPLMLSWPDADVPTVQLSLQRGLDPAAHLAIGRALAPLRDEGVFILGSGMSYHNLRAMNDPRAAPISRAFDAWLHQTAALDPAARDDALIHWEQAPAARAAHPREEHLLPLMVCAGAAEDDRATIGFSGSFIGWQISAVHFGV
jgi:aromatic ring-opening dioxygenase catalytic subunit (LigB family)